MKRFLTCVLSTLEFYIGVVFGVYVAVALVLQREWLFWLGVGSLVVVLIFDALIELIWHK
jgi:hypothetical protein